MFFAIRHDRLGFFLIDQNKSKEGRYIEASSLDSFGSVYSWERAGTRGRKTAEIGL
jgi:hypothetical protein